MKKKKESGQPRSAEELRSVAPADSGQCEAARNPLLHPKRGDVIRLPHDYRDRQIAGVTDTVSLMGQDRGRDVPMSYCALSVWPQMVRTAQVIRLAGPERAAKG